MTFTLKIKTGNDAMQTGSHIADALRAVADRIDGSASVLTRAKGEGEFPVRDINGNTVGNWKVG